jgi:GNAT superfamily N-acetyltransferase
VSGFDPVALETVEAEAVAGAFGAAAVRGAGAVCAFRADFEDVGINRVIGLGVNEPATAADLDRIAAVYGPVRHSIALAPCARPAGLAAMLGERGYEPASAWVKFHRPADPPPAAETELRVERIGPERAAQFTAVLGAGFELPAAVTAMLAHLPGLPGWGWYLAYDGDLAVACGAVFVRGDHAWLGQAATLPEHRRRGGQSAITAARIAAARAAGASVVVTETGEVVSGRPGSSYRNILRSGFEPAYVRPNYVSVPGTDSAVPAESAQIYCALRGAPAQRRRAQRKGQEGGPNHHDQVAGGRRVEASERRHAGEPVVCVGERQHVGDRLEE